MLQSLPSVPTEPRAEESAVQPLLHWLQHHPQFQHLHQDPKPAPTRSRQRRVLDWLLHQVGARPEEFHGTAYVTASLEQDSAIVAKVVTTSNWVDAVGNFNLLLFANGIANPIGWISAGLLTGILLKFDKEVYTSVARGRKGNRRLTYVVAMVGLLPFSALKTLGTGVGVEVMQNQAALEQRQATSLINQSLLQERGQIAWIQIADPTYAAVQQQCLRGQQQLARLPHTDPRWDSVQVELFGEWSERRQDWNRRGRTNLRPICVQQKLIEADQRQRTAEARRRVEALEQQRISTGNDLRFLKQAYPSRYEQVFNDQGQFRSSVQLVQVAIDNYLDKLAHGQWGQLGLSLYVLMISLLSSATACCMVLLHPTKPEVAMSWDEDVRRERDRWLAEQIHSTGVGYGPNSPGSQSPKYRRDQ